MSPGNTSRGSEPVRSRTNRAGRTRRSFLRATGVGIGGLALVGGGFSGTSGAVGNPTPRLATDGKWIVDPNGNRIKLRGFATAALEFIDYDWYPFTVEEVLERATDGETWHPNTIRLPVTEDAVHEEGMDYVVDLLRSAVDLLADRGVYAVIDFHLIRPYIDAMGNAEGMVEDGWADTIDDLGFDANVETHDLLVEFWSAVAPAFADDENVVFELFNEPTLPVEWADYGEYGADVTSREESWLLWRDAAQPWVDLIREEAPETPVVIGSPHWTSETQFAPEYPFEGENLIYAAHIYPDNGQPDEFDDEYGVPSEDVPVIVTEFGWDPDEGEDSEAYGTTSGWGEPVREWMESYENMGWLGWCFDDTWAPTFFDSPDEGVGEPWELKDDPEQQGWFIRQWLEDTSDDMIVGDGASTPTAPPDQWTNKYDVTAIELGWEAVPGADAYRVYLEGSLEEETEETTATITGLQEDTEYEVGVSTVADGEESDVTSTTVRTLSADDTETPPVIDGYQPADTTGDGLYNDITGSGSTTTTDVTVFFENVENAAVTDHPDSFDFDGNGDVSISDVIELFESL